MKNFLIAAHTITNCMRIGGLQKLSLVDFPGRVSAVVFTTGCVFRCGFCYNKNLVEPPFAPDISTDTIFSFLEKRKHVLDGIVITGGEPTLHADLPDFIRNIHALGYEIKLDSNGYFPERLQAILASGLVSYVAMDIKAPQQRYASVTDVLMFDMDRIRQSIRIIMQSGVPYEFRSTLIEGIHSLEDVEEMARLISGASAYYLQKFQPTDSLLDPAYEKKTAPSADFLDAAVARCRKHVALCAVRG